MNALKDGWMRELLFFVELLLVLTERPLRWGTFSLSYRFSKQPPTSVLSCLPASSSVASAAHFFSFTQLVQSAWQPPAATSHSTRAALWSRTTFRAAVTARVQPQLQTHLPGASQHHPRFVAHSRAIAFAPNPANVRAALTMGTRSRFCFLRFLCEKPSSRYSLVRILPATFPDRGKQRLYRGDPRSPEPHCPKKRTVSCLRVFSPVNSDASEHLSWWCGWYDDVAGMMVGMLTC